MMDDRIITIQLLTYLLKHRFTNKAEMARSLGMQYRTLEKVFARMDEAKGASIALGRALSYCLKERIPLDPIFEQVLADFNEEESEMEPKMAYDRLMLLKPPNLTEDGELVFRTLERIIFLNVRCCSDSRLICP